MEDPVLNRDLEETRELAQRWSQFHDFLRLGVKGEGITPQAEFKFLELKTRIAMLHDGFLHSAVRDPRVAQNVISVMAACILLRRLKGLNQTELQKLEFDWNEAYLLMTETIAHLEEERERLLLISNTGHKLEQGFRAARHRVTRVARHPLFLIGLIVGSIGFVVAGIPMLGLYDITRLKEDMPWTERYYVPVMRSLRTVFPNIPYADEREIEFADLSFGRSDPQGARAMRDRLQPKDFVNQLINRGFNVNDLDRVLEIFEARRHYSTSVFTDPDGNRVIAHQILLGTSEDARDFVRLRAAGIDKITDSTTRYRITSNITACRRGNLVLLLEFSTPEYRRSLARGRWGFSQRQIDL
jgi:hypothetical protein